MAITGAAFLGVVVSVLAATPADARDLPIKSGRWTDAPSCGDPSARDAANARTFEPGETITANDTCRIAIGQVRDKTYTAHLTCTYTQGGSGTSDIVLTVATPTQVTWRGLDPPFETSYRFCGSR